MSGRDLGFSLCERHSAPLQDFSFGSSPGLYASLQEASTESRTIDTKFFGKAVLGFPFEVSFEEVIEIRNDDFSGHVYNLQTESEMYLANNIVTHNCRCWLQPVVSEEAIAAEREKILAEYSSLNEYIGILTDDFNIKVR